MKTFYRILVLLLLCCTLLGSLCKRTYKNTKEARGLWITRWEWAGKEKPYKLEDQQRKIIEIFEKANQARLNFVVFQIRGNGDAFYQSEYEPWSNLLTGTLGKDPGWDPLTFALEQAHIRGLELHAWFNTFPAWKGKNPPHNTKPEHVVNAHPEWLVCDKNGKPMNLGEHYVSLSPGIPEVRKYIHQVAMDIVQKYDIDGFHFDYIRYPESSNILGYSHDPVSVRLFKSTEGNPQKLNWEDWQRENINQFVRKFYDEATSLKPWLKISAAVIGKYDNSSWNGYHIVYQDARRWLDEDKMDFIAPMIYWQTDHPTAPFGKITKDWLINYRHERFIFPGMMINDLGTEEWPVDEISRQVHITRDANGNGMIFFSGSGFLEIETILDQKGFPLLANFPAMSWKDDKPPLDPRNVHVEFVQPAIVKLTWSPPDSLTDPVDVWRYNIYRSSRSPVKYMNAENLLHIVAAADTVFFDNKLNANETYYYVITALDRVNNESPPSAEVEITVPGYVTIEEKNNTAD